MLPSSSFLTAIDLAGVLRCGRQRPPQRMLPRFLLIVSLLFITAVAFPETSSAQRRGDGSVRHSTNRQTIQPQNRQDLRDDDRQEDRRDDIHDDRDDRWDDRRPWNRQGRYHFLRHGHIVVGLPHGHIRVVVGGGQFFYYSGVYYTSGPSGYVVVPAPVGAVMATLPDGYSIVVVGGTQYFYYYGTYHVLRSGTGYVVVEAPVGAIVPYLPDGHTTVYVGGVMHYRFGGVHYRPYIRNGATVYISVRL